MVLHHGKRFLYKIQADKLLIKMNAFFLVMHLKYEHFVERCCVWFGDHFVNCELFACLEEIVGMLNIVFEGGSGGEIARPECMGIAGVL